MYIYISPLLAMQENLSFLIDSLWQAIYCLFKQLFDIPKNDCKKIIRVMLECLQT
jgi:hypothetical protein